MSDRLIVEHLHADASSAEMMTESEMPSFMSSCILTAAFPFLSIILCTISCYHFCPSRSGTRQALPLLSRDHYG